MRTILYALFEAATAGVFLIPCFLLLNKLRFRDFKATAAYLLLALYVSAVWALVGMPNVLYLRFELNFQLIPLLPMLSDLKNTVLNVALFVPLGCLLPVLWKKFRKMGSALAFCFGASLFIELAQVFTYRATDINDLISNTLGGLLGWAAGYWLVSKTDRKPLGKNRDISTVFACTLAVLFFLYPLLAEKAFLLVF